MGKVREYLPEKFSDTIMDHLTELGKENEKIREYLLSLAAPPVGGKGKISKDALGLPQDVRATKSGRIRRLTYQMLSDLQRQEIMSIKDMFELNRITLRYFCGEETAAYFDMLNQGDKQYVIEIAKNIVPEIYFTLSDRESSPKERLREIYERKYPSTSILKIPEHLSWFGQIVKNSFRNLPDRMEEIIQIAEELCMNLHLLFGIDVDIPLIARSPETEAFMSMYILSSEDARLALDAIVLEIFKSESEAEGGAGYAETC